MITDFLKTERTKKELIAALDVLQDFKGCENSVEWLAIPFASWGKLEQFEEFLEYLVNGKALQSDTVEYMKGETDSDDH